jgi:prepilin signal peptidase PulO-like enzyme (type II secretory pathway)
MIVIAIVLFFVGLMMGSFINALVWRLHEQTKNTKSKSKKVNLSILNGRSVCSNCKHQLAVLDLVPLFSWLFLKGKCRYCKKPIADSPLVELTAGLVFAGSYLFWPQTAHLNGQWLLLATWLVSSVGLLALAVYDLRWMILPNRIIYPTLLVAALGRLGYIIMFDNRPLRALLMWALSVAIASGIFFALFMASNGKWIGYGDVRLGLVTGTLLANPQKSFAMIFLASLIGSLLIMPALIAGKKNLASRLPYGPFLITATAIMVVFGDSILDWYKKLFGL